MADTIETPPRVSLHEQAAGGSNEAFSRIAAAHYANASKGLEPAIVGLARAVEFARLAAMQGGRRELMTFLFLLEEHAHAFRDVGLDTLADLTQGQAFALAEHAANEGDQEIADMLVRGAGEVEPGVLLAARHLMSLELH